MTTDNADGSGLTMTDNGQRYFGHYSDYEKLDSSDKRSTNGLIVGLKLRLVHRTGLSEILQLLGI